MVGDGRMRRRRQVLLAVTCGTFATSFRAWLVSRVKRPRRQPEPGGSGQAEERPSTLGHPRALRIQLKLGTRPPFVQVPAT